MTAASSPRPGPSRATRFFVYLVTAAGVAILVSVLWQVDPGLPPATWALLLLLTTCSESFGIKLPSLGARLTVSESFVFTSIFLFGSGPTILLVFLGGLIVPLWQRKRRKIHHLLFNTFEPVLSVWIASEAFFRISGLPPLSQSPADISVFVGPALLVAALYYLTNSSLTALAMALETRASPVAIWREHFVWLSLNSFVSVSIAGLLVQNPRVFLSSFAISLPLLAVSYLVFRSSIGRVEDAQRHLDELRRLYVSTIEAFAIAVDAKDQVTHGHIRRVQHLALGLARALEVSDEPSLRAIEAAGLLHDIGKLAIPDHILNKPGKLTAAEFDRMKLHAEAGAQILSAIDFPFPVVPIVRHHHENWDGSGYPAGLEGDRIPLGARILAVVDCFDALTSDRPYRRALSVEEAIGILKARRGSMYDPAVVDRFIEIYSQVVDACPAPDGRSQALQEIARSSHQREAPDSPLTGERIAGDMGRESPWSRHTDIADRATIALRAVLPVSMAVVYVYTPIRDELVPVYEKGAPESFAGARLPLGRTVSGWAAANRTTVVNGDPSLDIGFASESLRSCLAIPLMTGDKLLGVLTLYSEHEQAFDARAERVAQSVAPYLTTWIESASHVAASATHTSLPEIARSARTMGESGATRRPH